MFIRINNQIINLYINIYININYIFFQLFSDTFQNFLRKKPKISLMENINRNEISQHLPPFFHRCTKQQATMYRAATQHGQATMYSVYKKPRNSQLDMFQKSSNRYARNKRMEENKKMAKSIINYDSTISAAEERKSIYNSRSRSPQTIGIALRSPKPPLAVTDEIQRRTNVEHRLEDLHLNEKMDTKQGINIQDILKDVWPDEPRAKENYSVQQIPVEFIDYIDRPWNIVTFYEVTHKTGELKTKKLRLDVYYGSAFRPQNNRYVKCRNAEQYDLENTRNVNRTHETLECFQNIQKGN
jgi:hypothetical protein